MKQLRTNIEAPQFTGFIHRAKPPVPGKSKPALPSALVMAAKGADSIPASLRLGLEQTARVRYVANLAPLSPQAFIKLAQGFDYVAITRRAIERLDASTLAALPQLQGLSVYSTGVEWIDTAYLASKNIHLCSLPDYCSNAVAETALGLMFMTAHKLHLRYLKSTLAIPESVSLRGFELKSSTLGIIGFGRIGQLLAQKAAPLCKQVLVHDVNPAVFNKKPAPVQAVDLEELLQKSRFVVVCASQQFETTQLFDETHYSLFSKNSVLINVGRTSLLDHKRLIGMVKKERLASYVYDDLMRAHDDPDELEYGKIIPTGHTAWYTDESIQNGTRSWIENLITLCITV